MADVKITGTEEFVRVAKALNAQGSAGKGLKREMMAAIKKAAKPMEDEVRDHVGQYLPSGYAPVIAKGLVVRPSQATRGRSIGLKLVGHAKGRSKRRHIKVIDGGTLRHPVWGRAPWVDQSVKPGFWSKPLAAAREKPAKEIRRVIQEVARKIERAG
jgi:hypothetical protein